MNEAAVLNKEERLVWVEPEIRQLDIRETATGPKAGGDGQRNYPDCTRS